MQVITGIAAKLPPFIDNKPNQAVIDCINDICPPYFGKHLLNLHLKHLEEREKAQSRIRAAASIIALSKGPSPLFRVSPSVQDETFTGTSTSTGTKFPFLLAVCADDSRRASVELHKWCATSSTEVADFLKCFIDPYPGDDDQAELFKFVAERKASVSDESMEMMDIKCACSSDTDSDSEEAGTGSAASQQN